MAIFQNHLGRLVPECQTILYFTAAWDDGGESETNIQFFYIPDAFPVT